VVEDQLIGNEAGDVGLDQIVSQSEERDTIESGSVS
jgi:hypothetical protein